MQIRERPIALLLAKMGALALVLVLLAGCSTVTTGEERPRTPVGQIIPSRLAIVHTGAMGAAYPASNESVGLAAVVAKAHALEDEGYDVLLLDSGDSLLGSDLVDISGGENAIGFLNAAGYDAMTLGPRELSLSRRALTTRKSQSEFELLSANAQSNEEQGLPCSASATFTLSDGRVVGVFGLTGPTGAARARLGAGSVDKDEAALVEAAQAQVQDLRKKNCRLVICLTNLAQASGTLDAASLAHQVSGIDIILDAGDVKASHAAVEDGSGDESFVVTTPGGLAAATAVYWEQGTLSAELLDKSLLTDTDEQTQALITQTVLEQETWLEATIATSDRTLSRKRATDKECCLGDLVADALIWEARRAGSRVLPDVALVDAGSLESSLLKGDITRSQIFAICPEPTCGLYTAQVSGQQLLDTLKAAYATDADPREWLQVGGMTVSITTDRSSKKREVKIESVGGKPFSPQEHYLVVMTARVAAGTGAFEKLVPDSSSLTSLDTSAAKAVIGFIDHECHRTIPAIYQKLQGRIVKSVTGKRP